MSLSRLERTLLWILEPIIIVVGALVLGFAWLVVMIAVGLIRGYDRVRR